MPKLVNIAARNIRPGDMFKTHDGTEREVLRVERLDFEDRIMVSITLRDTSTWVPSELRIVVRLDQTFQVRKTAKDRPFMSWEPVYSDKTGKRKPFRGFC